MLKAAAVVDAVYPGSIAEEISIEPGDTVISINGRQVKDLIDYRYLTADENLEIFLKKMNGEEWILEIEKEFDEDIGISFAEAVFDRIKPCANKCVFCFVDQMPPGMRETLYIKDDDYRLSFLQGNFITLTNLTKSDFKRLIEMRLSPLYVSVHTTNPELRIKMLGNKKAGKILEQLRALADTGITIHSQIVLCPGLNDGEELEKTVTDLVNLWPAVQSVAVVPVGLTAFREDLAPLRRFTADEAREVINRVSLFQDRLRKKFGKTLVYLSDEFYLKAGYSVPDDEYYDEYEQLENGVGFVRLLYNSFCRLKDEIPPEILPGKKVVIATGILGQQAVEPLIEELNKVKNLSINLLTVENKYFGSNVTVTGLITGSDILASYEDKAPDGDILLIPAVMCRKGDDIFLDGLTIQDISDKLGIPVKIIDVSDGVRELFDVLFH